MYRRALPPGWRIGSAKRRLVFSFSVKEEVQMGNNVRVKIAILLSAMAMMTFLVPAPVFAGMVQAFPSTDPTMIQMIIGVPSLVSIPLGLVAARLAKRFHKKYLVIFGTCCYLVGGLTPFFFHPSAEFIVGCSVIIGVGMGIAMTALTALIGENFEGAARGAMFGLYAAFISLGGTLAAILGGVLGCEVWYRAFLAYLILIPIILCEFAFLPVGRLDQEEEDFAPTSKHLSPSVWLIALTGFVFYVCVNVINNNASMLVAERALGDSNQASIVTSCYTFAGFLCGFFVGKIVMKVQRKSIALGYLLGAVGLIVVYVGGGLVAVCAGTFIAGVGFCLYASTANFHVTELSTPSTLTFSIAFLSAVINLGQAFSAPIVNALSAPFGTDTSSRFLVTAALCAVMAVVSFFGLKNAQPATASVNEPAGAAQ